MSWWRRLVPRTLAGKFLVFQLGVVGLVLLVAGLVSVRESTSQFASSSGDRVLGAAENVAGNPLVKDAAGPQPGHHAGAGRRGRAHPIGRHRGAAGRCRPADHHLHRSRPWSVRR